MKLTTAVLAVAALTLAAMPAFAQKKAKTPKTTAAPAATTPATPHVSGMVKKPGVTAGKFSMGGIGKANKGTWTVDGSSATVADKKGGTVALTDITPGSNVSVEGTVDSKAHTITASKITANYIPKKKATTTTTPATTTKPKKGKKTKTTTPAAGSTAPAGTTGTTGGGK
jgi:hypothetical protein